MNLSKWKLILVITAVALMYGSAIAQQAQKPSNGDNASASSSNEAVGPERITVNELKTKLANKESVIIIDIRGSDYDASEKKIMGAIRIAPAELEARLKELPRDKEIVTYCACSTDGGAIKARQTLLEHGFKNVRALKGGWNAWNAIGGPVETK